MPTAIARQWLAAARLAAQADWAQQTHRAAIPIGALPTKHYSFNLRTAGNILSAQI